MDMALGELASMVARGVARGEHYTVRQIVHPQWFLDDIRGFAYGHQNRPHRSTIDRALFQWLLCNGKRYEADTIRVLVAGRQRYYERVALKAGMRNVSFATLSGSPRYPQDRWAGSRVNIMHGLIASDLHNHEFLFEFFLPMLEVSADAWIVNSDPARGDYHITAERLAEIFTTEEGVRLVHAVADHSIAPPLVCQDIFRVDLFYGFPETTSTAAVTVAAFPSPTDGRSYDDDEVD